MALEVRAQEPDNEIRFGQDVQPLLARRCFACHGPDTAEAGLRLNSLEHATEKLESGLQAIAPGAPDQSELLKRIRSTEEGHRMPPEGKPLTEREQKILETWIAQGAQWKQHWAFEPLTKPEVPQATFRSAPVDQKAADQQADEHPIDAFIEQKLAKRGLSLAPQAEPIQLLRRLYYDLIGLPPTPAQVAAFLEKRPPQWKGR